MSPRWPALVQHVDRQARVVDSEMLAVAREVLAEWLAKDNDARVSVLVLEGDPAKGTWDVSINLAALDDLDPAELVDAPITYFNGRDNAWMEKPAETRHL